MDLLEQWIKMQPNGESYKRISGQLFHDSPKRVLILLLLIWTMNRADNSAQIEGNSFASKCSLDLKKICDYKV